jgi:peptidyl-prolyl cis-trans isomerase D
MLNLMRKHAGSWMIKVMLFAISVVFVFWGVGSIRTRKATEVANINGAIITQQVYQEAYNRLVDNYRRIYGAQYNEELLKMLHPNELALDQLINNILMMQEAARLKIEVSDDELAQSIRQIPAFQYNGVFDIGRYNQLLAQNNMSVEQFEKEQSDQIVIQKLRAAVLSGVTVTENEARQWYKWSEAQINLEYVLFPPTRYQDINPSQGDVENFYKDHADAYRTEPRIRVTYLYFNPEAYRSEVHVTDEQVAEYYHDHPDEFKAAKRVQARHILIKVDKEADEKTVAAKKAEAEKIYKMAAAGQNFADLAKKYSEGPSKHQGGELGWFTRDKMVAPFADKAFDMKVGEVSEPVRTRFGWHIIKVEKIQEAATTSLEAASEKIRVKLTDEKAKGLALEKAQAVYDSVFDGDDLAAAGRAHQVPVATTDFFTSKGPDEKGIGQPQKFASVAFGLEKMAISEVQDLGNGFYILQTTQRMDAKVPPLEEVADRVKAGLIKSRQDAQAKADAQAFLAKVQKGDDFAKVCEEFKVVPLETGFFGRQAAIPQIGFKPQIQKEAFQLTMAKPLMHNVVQGSQGWYVLRLRSRQGPDDAGFAKEKDAIVKRLTEQKRQSTFQSWIEDLRSKGKIEIHKEMIKL